MKQITIALTLWGAFNWSDAMAQTQEQGHKHEQQLEVNESPPSKGVTMKDEMKEKMKEKMKDMKCCQKDDHKEPKS